MAERGGARTGAGRPKNELLELKRQLSVNILGAFDEEKEWKAIYARAVERNNDDLRYRILAYHSDQKYGRAPQRVILTGDENADPVKVLLIGEQKKHGKRA